MIVLSHKLTFTVILILMFIKHQYELSVAQQRVSFQIVYMKYMTVQYSWCISKGGTLVYGLAVFEFALPG